MATKTELASMAQPETGGFVLPDHTKGLQNYAEWRKGIDVEPKPRYGESIDCLCTWIWVGNAGILAFFFQTGCQWVYVWGKVT